MNLRGRAGSKFCHGERDHIGRFGDLCWIPGIGSISISHECGNRRGKLMWGICNASAYVCIPSIEDHVSTLSGAGNVIGLSLLAVVQKLKLPSKCV